ncbi:hypothetical protein DL95DRAFT_362975 [Leptodontidium sp. 2 PMI_412]|nr:hypothetical protein DL95DRAFT_362975 [Leptodontidium sp. 2 PMI_412]
MIILRQAETHSAATYNESSANQLLTTAILFIVLNTLFVTLRYYARHITKAGLGWDDFFLSAGYVSNIGLCVTAILIVPLGGVGHYISEVKQDNPALVTGWAKGIFAVELIYLTSVALPKLSVLVLYLRIFTTRGCQISAQGTIALVTLNWVAFVVSCLLQCRPLAFWWDRTIEGGSCFDVQAFYRAMCVPNLFTDLIVMLLPMQPILKLRLEVFKKIALLIIFLTASIGLVASIIRFTVFFRTDAFTDSTWSSVPLVSWSIVESSMYLIAACLPLLRPIFTKHSPAWLKNISASFTSRYKPRSYHVELNSHSGARPGFMRPNESDGAINDNTTKSKFGEETAEDVFKDVIRSESEVLPPQGIKVTGEVRI